MAVWTPQDFYSMFGHFKTLFMKGLKIWRKPRYICESGFSLLRLLQLNVLFAIGLIKVAILFLKTPMLSEICVLGTYIELIQSYLGKSLY